MRRIDISKYSEDAINEMREKQDKEFSKICENWKDKVILIIRSELYYPYVVENVEGDISLYSKYKFFGTGSLKVATPYKNKNVFKMVSRKGAKVCKEGVVFVFDSFEEIQKLNSLKIVWTVHHPERNSNQQLFNAMSRVVVDYKLNFEKADAKNNVFCIYTNDFPLNFIFSDKCDEKIRASIIQEYDKIIQTQSNINETKSSYLKGGPVSFPDRGNESFFIHMVSFKGQELDDIFTNNGTISLYYYGAEETLEPHEIALF